MRIIKLPALAFAIISATVPAAAAIAASAFIYSSQQSALPCSADKAALCSNNDTLTLQFTQLPGDFFPLPPRGPLPGPPPFAHPPDIQLDARPGFVHSPRLACEERLHREAALQRYLESRLRLTPAQHEAWQKLELTAEPITSRRLELCAETTIASRSGPRGQHSPRVRRTSGNERGTIQNRPLLRCEGVKKSPQGFTGQTQKFDLRAQHLLYKFRSCR
jgi:hypothetical protein